MRTISILFVSMVVTVALSATNACTPYSPSLPAEPFLCGSADPKCPEGYNCTDGGGGRMVCLIAMGTVTDGGADASHCADDSQLEPNNDIMHATQTPIDSNGTKKTIPYAGLAICPAGDKDVFSVTITQGAGTAALEALVTYDAGGAALQVSILTMAGTSIANGSPAGTNMIRAYVMNIPVGSYYVQVYGPASGVSVTNNYKLTITETP